MSEPRHLCLAISPEDSGKTVSILLRKSLCLSAGAVRRAKTLPTGITLDGTPVFTNATVSAGQVLCAQVGDSVMSDLTPIPGDLALCYEDEDLLVINKPGGLPVHPGPGALRETLANRLIAYYHAIGLTAAFHPVNRLDRGTSGLMVVAKHAHAHERLISLLHSDNFSRCYLAICEGVPPCETGILDFPIARCEGSALRREVADLGQSARTQYCLLAQQQGRSLLALRLFTGRTHQIRVHLSHIGTPVVGDFLYGQEDVAVPDRFALHAAYIRLRHPLRDELLSLFSPLPPELARLFPSSVDMHTLEAFCEKSF